MAMWCITGINPLTGDKERISRTYPDEQKPVLENMLKRFKKIPARRRLYLLPKIEACQEELFK